MKRARCVSCGKPISALFMGADSPVHSQKCGKLLAIRLLEAEPSVLDLLPPKWDMRTGKARGS